MVELKLTYGENTFFIIVKDYETVQDLIDKLKERIILNNPTLLYKGEPLNTGSTISSLKLKNLQKIIFNDKYNGGA